MNFHNNCDTYIYKNIPRNYIVIFSCLASE